MVERRAEAVQEGDAAEPRAGEFGCVGVSRDARSSAQQPLDLSKKDLRESGDGSGPVGQHAHGDHPLSHGHRWDDVIGEMRRRLGHVPAVAGWADAAALAGEGHDESRAALHADRAGEAEAEEPAKSVPFSAFWAVKLAALAKSDMISEVVVRQRLQV